MFPALSLILPSPATGSWDACVAFAVLHFQHPSSEPRHVLCLEAEPPNLINSQNSCYSSSFTARPVSNSDSSSQLPPDRWWKGVSLSRSIILQGTDRYSTQIEASRLGSTHRISKRRSTRLRSSRIVSVYATILYL